MIVNTAEDAQIALLLVSRDRQQILELRRDLQASKYDYLLMAIRPNGDVRREFCKQVSQLLPMLPVVAVMDFGFLGPLCGALLQHARDEARGAAMACVVTHVPPDDALQAELRGLGAVVFAGEGERLTSCLGLN